MSNDSETVCIITDDIEGGKSLRDMMRSCGREACIVASSLACLESLDPKPTCDLVMFDRSYAAIAIDDLENSLQQSVTATFGRAGSASPELEALEEKANYQLRHPVELADLQRLFNCIENPSQNRKPTDRRDSLHLYRGLVGISDAVEELKSVISKVAPFRANVLILGETGTGKEVVARNIHYRSANNGGPFVPVNCSAIPADLLESELFGHKKGTFTGAINDRVGRFELAAEGTLFLDEIGDMPAVLQSKLLRVLEERVIYPLGGDRPVPMTGRLIAATHCDLEKLVAEGKFREDLYYRLNVVPIDVPPLRDRREDVPHLARELSCRLQQRQEAGVEFSPEALERMSEYNWPGNVRELANLVERLTVMHPDGTVEAKDLPAEILAARPAEPGTAANSAIPERVELTKDFDLKHYLALTEASVIRQALDRSGGVVTRAAKMLHVGRTTLTEKVKRLGLAEMIDERF